MKTKIIISIAVLIWTLTVVFVFYGEKFFTNAFSTSATISVPEVEETYPNPELVPTDDISIVYVEPENILFGVERYDYSEEDERFVRAFLKTCYKTTRIMRDSPEYLVKIEPYGTVVSVTKPFPIHHRKGVGEFYVDSNMFCCAFIVDGHIVGEFFVSKWNGDRSYSAGYNPRFASSFETRIGLTNLAQMRDILPADTTAPYYEALAEGEEDDTSGIWFSFIVQPK